MSGIFGLVHLDNEPVSKQEMESMRVSMADWGLDGGEVWLEGAAGLGSLILFNTPEAVNEKLPLQSSQGFILTAEARLDNRAELFSELDIDAKNHNIPDGQLILRAYERWAEKTPDHLLGDWSFAAWHPKEKKLFLARDHFGNTALYYYHDRHRFAFASSRKALFALGIPHRVNEFFLACLLVSWPAHHGQQTIEQDLYRLPPAHTLTLQDGHIQINQYWRLEDIPEQRLKNSQDYIDGFLTIYDSAVRDRLRSYRTVCSTLSGGLDSSSVSSLAARALRIEGKRLAAYTSVPLYDVNNTVGHNGFGDELPFAQATASFNGNIDLVQIDAANFPPIQAIRRALEIHSEPGHAAGNMYWIYDMFASAQRDDVGVLLTGQGGNSTVSWTGAGKMSHRLFKSSSWKQAFQLILFPFMPLPLLRRISRVRNNWESTAIQPNFAQELDLANQIRRDIGSINQSRGWYSPRQQRYVGIKPGASFLGSIWAEDGAAHHMEVRDPTFDKRVMEFTLSIPDCEFSGPDGYNRWMIRTSMKDILPDEVRLNRRRGLQAADLGQRLINTADEVENAFSEVEGSDLAQRYLSTKRMREVWDALRKEINQANTHDATTILTRGLMAGLYLSDLEKKS